MEPAEFDRLLASARERLADEDPEGALATLRPVFSFPALELCDRDCYREATDVLADTLKELDKKLGKQVARARRRYDDADALYEAAYQLYEHQLHDLAAGILVRANRLRQGDPKIVTELCACLEATMQNREAAQILRKSRLPSTDLWCRYLLGFNSLMAGDLDTVEELLPLLSASQNEEIVRLSTALSGMLARAKAIGAARSLDGEDLAGWHAVINGSVLLYVSPHGFEDGMRGRFAYVNDSDSLVRTGLDRLKLVLGALDRTPERIWQLPDPASALLAKAAAETFHCELAHWPGGGREEPGLIVAYDLDTVCDAELLESLSVHRPGQLLWTHASCWTNPFPFTPDVTTYLYQVNQPLELSEPGDEQAMTARLKSIAEAPAADESPFDQDSLSELVRAAASTEGDAAIGALLESGPRRLQRTGSPVHSNRFA